MKHARNSFFRSSLFACFVAAASCPLPAPGQQSRWQDLKAQVEQRYQQGDYVRATPLAMEALKVAVATFGPAAPDTATALNNLGLLYAAQSKYTEAEPLLRRALSIREKALGEDDPQVARSLGVLAQLYGNENKYADAVPLFQHAIAIDEMSLGPDSADIATLCGNLAEVYQDQGDYANAEPQLQRALHIDERVLGPDNPGLAADLNNLAELYDSEGKYAAELPLLERALAINQKAYEQDHPIVAKAQNNLAEVYEELGRYSDAEPLLKRSLEARESKLGAGDPEVAVALSNLAELDMREALYKPAESLLQRAFTIDEKALGPNDPAVAVDLNNQAELYETQGEYATAEPLFQRSLAIREKILGPDHPDVATALGNLGALYSAEGKDDKARSLFRRALEIDRQKLDPAAPQLAADLNNLATVAENQGAYADAEDALQLVLEIDEKSLGKENPTIAAVLANLAGVYFDEDKYTEAEPAIQLSLKIDEGALGPNHPDVANGLNLLASIYDGENKFADAAPLHQRAIHIQETSLGPNHPALANTVVNFAENLDARGDFNGAELQYQRAFDNLFRQFEYNFTFMTEKDRLEFLHTVDDYFPVFFSFVYRFHERDPQLAGAMYNLLLWEKGFIAGSIASMRQQIEDSGDKEALKLLDELSAKRAQIAALINAQPPDRELWRKQIEQLESDADTIEKALVTRSAGYAAQKELGRTTWQQVRDALKPGEAAVEFARFQYFENKWTTKSYYVALVITRETKDRPEYIVLGDDKQIESEALLGFKQSVQTRGLATEEETSVPGAHAYDVIWKPLEMALAGKTRIYVSADGALNEVPLGVIPGPDGKLLMERFDLRLVSSTRDLLRPIPETVAGGAILVGDPAFDASVAQQRMAQQRLSLVRPGAQVGDASSAIAAPGIGSSNAVVLPPLQGTGTEINTIAGLMKSRGWKAGIYTEGSALKTAVELADRPRVVHLATHGFFLPDPALKDRRRDVSETLPPMADPMLRSGLYFAGADRTLSGAPPAADIDNGVLTAMEAANLNLHGTELVVLSACNTGKGDVRNGEGVFGLRRALQEAGAQSVLMSLWSVPDQETLELMQRFYAKWLGGTEKHEALKEAQLEVREEVKRAHGGQDLPFYWGAFVLVGQ